jgi:hypothetical protein
MKTIIANAHLIAESNYLEAIYILEKSKGHPRFYPHGAFAMADYCKKAGQDEYEFSLLANIFDHSPLFMRNWKRLIEHKLMDFNERRLLSSRMLRLLNQTKNIPAWMNTLIPELLIYSKDPNIEKYLELLHFMRPEDSVDMTTILVVKIRRCAELIRLALLSEKNEAITWRFIVNRAENRVCFEVDGVLKVNLGAMNLGEITSWSPRYAGLLLDVIIKQLPCDNYSDDSTVESWKTVRKGDTSTCHLLMLLRSHYLKYNPTSIQSKPPRSKIKKGGLYVRVGVVELNALHSILQNSELMKQYAEDAFELLSFTSAQELHKLGGQSYWTGSDHKTNFIKLATNAGFYSPPKISWDQLRLWGDNYIEAMERGTNLYCLPDLIVKFCSYRSKLRKKRPYAINPEDILDRVTQSRTIVVSAYSKEINTHLDNGGLFNLWKDMGVKSIKSTVTAIQAPMSIWPYKPHESWGATFENLCGEVSNAIEHSGAETLIASCGCYGLPLVNRMNKIHGITAIYNGHSSNIFFGILTKATRNDALYKRFMNSNYWIESTLSERAPEICRVDRGRYI